MNHVPVEQFSSHIVHQQISIALFVASGQEEGGPFPSTLLVHI